MNRIQRLMSGFFPAEAMQAETEGWQIRCLGCGKTRDLWAAGGVRYGKRSKRAGSETLVRCPGCGTLRRAVVERVPAEE